MQDTLQGFNWTVVQSHLPVIVFILVAVPLSMLLWADFIKITAKNARNKKVREERILAPYRDKDGMPVYLDVFGQPIHAEAPVATLSDFERRRVAAMRGGKSRHWQ